MGRKLFGMNLPALEEEDGPETTASPSPAAEVAQPVQPRARARSAQALGAGILELTQNAIRDLETSDIVADGPQDRLGLDPAAISALADSIRTHGQQVPILVRPHGDKFKIVYGRRRLAAVRSLGNDFRVKAIIRTLADDAAVIAQGQENNLRLDPSYIEKALFARALRETGYEPEVIQDALGIDRTAISKMKTVIDNVPMAVIEFVGAAHEVGRPAWTELATMSRDDGVNLLAVLDALDMDDAVSSGAEKFAAVLSGARHAAAQRNIAASQHETVTAVTRSERTSSVRKVEHSGRHFGTMKRTGSSLSLNLSLKHQPGFGEWFEKHADEIIGEAIERWTESQGEA